MFGRLNHCQLCGRTYEEPVPYKDICNICSDKFDKRNDIKMNHGKVVKDMIENVQITVRNNGQPVIVDNSGTIELLYHNFAFQYLDPIDIEDIHKSMENYYEEKDLDLTELQELEKSEYAEIENELVEKFEFFDQDINSRRVLWTDDCCISMVHYLIRDGVIHCYVHLRSSDVVYKLFSDLYLIHKITKRLQDKLNLYNTNIWINAHSAHEVVIKNVGNIKLDEKYIVE
jgi:thymidylate synthase